MTGKIVSIRALESLDSGGQEDCRIVSVLWGWLVELEGHHLPLYGEVPPGLAEYLEPRLAILIGHLRNISAITARRGADRSVSCGT